MRTPLFRSLRQIVTDLRIAEHRQVPVDVVREERRRAEERAAAAPRGIGRRALLGGAVAAAGALAIGRRARAGTGNANAEIAIIGGGMAGMACADHLASYGISFKVYEASGRIGGRMYSNNSGYWADGQVSEWGGELIDTNHVTVQSLATDYGLELDNLLDLQPAGSEELYYAFGAHYGKHQADDDFRAMWEVVKADAQAAGYPTTHDSYSAHGYALDHLSVHDWIASRVPGGHASRLGRILDVAYNIEYGAETYDQSSLNLLYLLAYQPKPVAFASFGESDERYHIRGGNQQLPKAIADSLPAGTVEHGHKLVRIALTSSGRVKLTFSTSGGTVEKTFDRVALCIPFAMLADVDYSQAGFDALKVQAIRNLGRGHNGKLQLQFNRRTWAGTGSWPGIANGSTFSDSGYQCSWEPTRGQAGQSGILNLYSGGSVTDAMKTTVPFATHTNAKVVQDAQAGLARIGVVFPGLQWNGRATQSIWHKNPFTQHSYAFYRVGQYTAFGGHEGVPQGPIHVAGDHTSQDFQGFMEGAAETGVKAGKEIRQAL